MKCKANYDACVNRTIRGDRGARQERQQAGQDPGPRRRGRAESGTWKGPGSEVPRGRVLRSARHRAGQVRDAAPRIGRECVGNECHRRVRCVEADLLSDKGRLRGGGDRRIGTQEAGSARSTKVRGAVLAFIQEKQMEGEPLRARQLAEQIRKKFDLDIHPRTIERAVAVKKNRALTLGGVRSEWPATRADQFSGSADTTALVNIRDSVIENWPQKRLLR